MRSILTLFVLACAIVAPQLHAQSVAPVVKFKGIKLIEQPTPQISGGGVKEKRWKAKNWIEVDVTFEIRMPAEAGGNKASYSGIKTNIYLALQHTNKEGKRTVLQGSFETPNVPSHEEVHLLGYVSPVTMKSIMMKDLVIASTDVQGWGVEIYADGNRVDGDSSTGKSDAWWETKKDAFEIIQGTILPKSKTPFSILWGDYDLQTTDK